MRTVRIMGWILFSSTALALSACSQSVSPTALPDTGRVAIKPNEREAALKVIDKAIQAHGGKEALGKTRFTIRDGTGTKLTPKGPQSFTEHTFFAFPDRVKMDLEFVAEKTRRLTVLNGARAWESVNNQTTDMDPSRASVYQQDLYMTWLTTLLPLLGDDVEVGIQQDEKVDDRPVTVVRVTAKEKLGKHDDVYLSFDKETGLLVRARWADFNNIYSGHKDFDGVKMPTHLEIKSAGETKMEASITSWKFPPKADEVEFQKP